VFGFGFSELMIVLVIALLVIGPKKLPEVAKSMGKLYGQLKRAMDDIKESVDLDIDINDHNHKKTSTLDDIYRDKWKNKMMESDKLKENDTNETDGKETEEKEKNNNEVKNIEPVASDKKDEEKTS